MKKILFLNVIICISISKLHAQSENDSFNVKVINKMLAFSKFSDYEKIVNQPSEKQQKEFASFLKSLKEFTSLRYIPYTKENANKRSLLIDDEFFCSLLNVEKTIQIDKFIFKINPEKQKVYVLPIQYENEYNDLIKENKQNKHILIYSTGDDVLTILKDNTNVKISDQSKLLTLRSSFCREGGIGGKHAEVSLNGRQTAYADYLRYGIYYSLKAEISPVGSWSPSTGSGYKFSFEGSGWVHYHVRCGTTVDYGNFITNGTWSLTRQLYQSYQGSTNLNNLFFAFRILNSVTGLPIIPSNPIVVIRQNW